MGYEVEFHEKSLIFHFGEGIVLTALIKPPAFLLSPKGISKNRAEHFVKISMLKFGAEIL